MRLRQHWRPLVLFAAFLALTMGVFGSSRVIPYITGDDRYEAPVVTENIAGTVDLFDTSVAHSVQLTFRQVDYERILQTWYDEGEKEYLEADMVIDGVRIDSVGVRLKGNSTLMSLQDPNADPNEQRGRAQPPGGMQFPAGGELPQGLALPGGRADIGAGGGAGAGGGMPGIGGVGLSAEEPENLPWLLSFDEFAEGRQYQGRSEIALRPASSSSTVSLNESVALSLVAQSGQVGQDHTYASFTVNDRPTTARLIVEHPDEAYTEKEFGTAGVLYKSRASSSFTDQGDDPTEYEDDFKQINRVGSQDLQPVINLIQWVQNASDEEFAAELGEHVDIDSFARYLATQNLLLNFDDMSGPGKNYYLWYDLDTKKFQVVTWDLNLTFGGDAATGPHDNLSMGGLLGGRGQGADEAPPGGIPGQNAGADPAGANAARPDMANGSMMQGNKLKERFLAAPEFTTVYQQAYRDLYQQFYGSGAALTVLDQVTAAAIEAAEPTDRVTITEESAALRGILTARASALADDPVVAAGMS